MCTSKDGHLQQIHSNIDDISDRPHLLYKHVMTTSEGHRLHTLRKWQASCAKRGLFYLSCTNLCVHSESHMVSCLHSFNLVPTCVHHLQQLQVHAMTQTSLPRYRCRCKAPPLSCALLCDSYTTSWMLFMGGLGDCSDDNACCSSSALYGCTFCKVMRRLL